MAGFIWANADNQRDHHEGARHLCGARCERGPGAGLLDRSETSDHVGVYRLMAKKGAGFVAALDECIGEMLEDGTIDDCIKQYVGADFMWNGDYSASGTSTVAGK